MSANLRTPNPLKWHGGKNYLANKIIELFPPRHDPKTNPNGWLHYVEPYFGGGSVLLGNDPEGISEVVSDLNGKLTDFWMVLQNEPLFEEFKRLVEAMPFSEDLYECAQAFLPAPHMTTNYQYAAYFFVACRQSLSGRMKGFTGITKTRTRRGMNNEVSAWLTAVEGLPEVHARLKRVLILNRPALEVIKQQDGPQTLFYLDPPYMHETRKTTKEYGEYEMNYDDHAMLLTTLYSIQGKFLLSGYHSNLYDMIAQQQKWKCFEFNLPNQASGSKSKRIMTECVWTNY